MAHPLILDCRRPGQAMAPVPLKLPADAVAQLQAQADALGYSRSALSRHLLMEGLQRLEATPPAVVVTD